MLKRMLIYIAMGIFMTVAPLYYMNNMLFSDAGTTFSPGSKHMTEPRSEQLKLPVGAKCISMLYNQEYIAYIDSGSLQVEDILKNEVYRTISEESDVLYAVSMEDRNIVIYFTYADNKLSVKTYNLDRDDKTDHKSIDVKNFNKIKSVRYSSLTNVIYIDVEAFEGNALKDKIYRVDIMKDVTLYSVSKGISSLMLLNNKDTLIYQDYVGNIYIKGKLFKYHDNSKFKLLGVDKDDRVYISPLDNMYDLFVVKDGEVEQTRNIDDPGYIRSLNRDNKIYLIYRDRILEITENREMKKDETSSVIDIMNNIILYDNGRNDIIIERIKL